ncbi:UNVERIFIED_CONTAM: hypothetical protein Sradi_4147600 [Sesamum radiatum]|uniref:Uncharacterized protein n=1 Tax=Sesamum radiatum TaxID=300843 RepID=A0AAW2P1Y7_SESRA
MLEKAQIRERNNLSLKEVLDIEAMEDTPLIQFGRTEKSGLKTHHDNALVITALLADYEVGRIFINFRSSADILFEKAYNVYMQLGDIPLEKVNTSLYRFAGEIIHPRGMISLLLKLGTQTPQKICMIKFPMVDVSSAYNAILGRPALKAFQAVISTCHMKIKFLAPGGMGEVQRDPLLSRKCYIETVRKGQKRNMEETYKEAPSNKQRKGVQQEEKSEEGEGTSPKVLPAKKMLNIELSLGDSGKTTQIGSQMDDTIWKEVI